VVGEVGIVMAQNTNTDNKTVEKDGSEYEFEYNETFGVWKYAGGMDISDVPLDVFYAFRDADLPTAQFQGAREKVAERFSEKYGGHVPFEIGAREHFDIGDEWSVREETAVTYRGVEVPIVAFQQVA
jgi:hypothetical protein